MSTVLAELRVLHQRQQQRSSTDKPTVERTHYVALDASHCLLGRASLTSRRSTKTTTGILRQSNDSTNKLTDELDKIKIRRSVTFSAIRQVVPALPVQRRHQQNLPVSAAGVSRTISAEIHRQARARACLDADFEAIKLSGIGLDPNATSRLHEEPVLRSSQTRPAQLVRLTSCTSRPATAATTAPPPPPPLESSYCLLAKPLPPPPPPPPSTNATRSAPIENGDNCPLCLQNRHRLARLDCLINQLTLSSKLDAQQHHRRPFTASSAAAASAEMPSRQKKHRRLTGRTRPLQPMMPPTMLQAGDSGDAGSTEAPNSTNQTDAAAFHACLASEAFIARELSRQRQHQPESNDPPPELPDRLPRFSENFYNHFKRPKTGGCLFLGRRPWPLREVSWRGADCDEPPADDGWGSDDSGAVQPQVSEDVERTSLKP